MNLRMTLVFSANYFQIFSKDDKKLANGASINLKFSVNYFQIFSKDDKSFLLGLRSR